MKTHTRIIMSLLATFLVVRMLPDVVADEAEDLIVIQQAACNKPVFLSKQLVLEFAEPNAVAWLMEKNGSLLADMETILEETYNELSFYSCDSPLFRQIHNISVFDDASDDNGTSADYHNYYGSPTLTFELEMSCSNCTAAHPLFETPVIPLDTSVMNVTATNTTANMAFFQTDVEIVTRKTHTKRQGNHSEYYYCICPSNHDIYPASMTVEDFVLLANEKLVAEQMNITITHSMELEEVTCSEPVRQFTSRIYMDMYFSGIGLPSEEEVRSLKESLMQTYNRLSFESCDQYHRKINRAKLGFRLDAEDFLEEVDMPPAWQNTNATMASNNLSLWWNTTSWNKTSPWWNNTNWNSTSNESSTLEVLPKRHILKAVFTVDAECRNCSVNSAGWFTLFDNGAGLELPTGEAHRNASGNPDTEEISLKEKARSNLRHAKSSARQKSLPTAWQDPTNTTTCVCPVKQEPDMTLTNDLRDSEFISASSMALTEGSFLNVFNLKIKQAKEDEAIEMVESASNIEEGQATKCGPNISSFNSQVFAGIRVDPTTITSQQIRKMEKAVMDTYNDLAFRSCDGLFRAITEAELVFYHSSTNSSNGMADEIFQYQNSSSNFHNSSTYIILSNSSSSLNNTNSSDGLFIASSDDARREFVATMFSIKGECRGCGVSSSGSFNLFDDAFGGGRRLQANEIVNESIPHPNKHTGGFKEEPSTCFCLAGVEVSSTGQGPTSGAFGEALTKEISMLDHNGEIESVEATVGDVLEGLQVSCTGEVQDFTSYVYSELEFENGQANDEVKETLESVFVETYNSLAFQACDEFFRVVGEVKLLISDELKPAPYNLNVTRAPGTAATHFEVIGHCRNCDVNNGYFHLFDDAIHSNSKVRNRGQDKRTERSIPNGNTKPRSGNTASDALDFCSCPHGKQPGEDLPPSKERFLSEFNRNFVKNQKEKGSPEEENTEEVGETPLLFIEEVVPPSRGGAPISFFVPFSSPTIVSPDSSAAFQPYPQPTFEPTPASSTGLEPSGDLTSLPSPQPTFSQTVGETNLAQDGSSTLQPSPQPTFEPTPHSTPNVPLSSNFTLLPSPQPTFPPTTDSTKLAPDGSVTLQPSSQPTFEPTPGSVSTPNVTPRPAPLMEPITQPNASPDPYRQPTSQPTREPTDRATNLVEEPTPAPLLTLTVTLPPIPRPSPEQAPSPVLTLTVTLPPNPRTSPKPTSQPSPRPTPQPTPSPTPNPTQRPTPSPTPEPTPQPVPQPSPNPTPIPTSNPTQRPSAPPTQRPTPEPTPDPTSNPTAAPTKEPTPEPTPDPTSVPTTPTPIPTKQPTPEPTPDPTSKPSGCPTLLPSSVPSSPYPSVPPSNAPTQNPSVPPSNLPF